MKVDAAQMPAPGRFRRFCRSCWQVPLVLALACCIWGLALLLAMGIDSWSGGLSSVNEVLTGVVMVVSLLVLAVGCMAYLWLLVCTVCCCRRRAWLHLLRCWGSMAVAGLAAFGCMWWVAFQCMLGDKVDWYMLGVNIPENREYVTPRGLRAVQGEVREASLRAQELLSLRPKRQPLQVLVQMPPLPNLEKLTREAPELLQEYLLRCLYAETTNPCFDAQVLSHWHEPVALVHAHDPQSYVLRRLAPEVMVDGPGEAGIRADWAWCWPLHGQWALVTPPQYPFEIKHGEQVAGAVNLLEESLAPLAANPTREGLDALLPPLPPQKPFLCLWDASGDGRYYALVVLPPGFPEGSIELNAREVSTGKPVNIHHGYMQVEPLGAVCSVAADTMLLVQSGKVNEFYATEWEIWFTPEAGGEPRCLGKQEFLLMGGDAWW